VCSAGRVPPTTKRVLGGEGATKRVLGGEGATKRVLIGAHAANSRDFKL
jgi:hypothetical protein